MRLPALSVREKKLLRFLMLIIVIGFCITVLSRTLEKFSSLTKEGEQKSALLQKALNGSTAGSYQALEKQLELLKTASRKLRGEETLDTFSFGEKILTILGSHSIRVSRYRPLEESSFSFAGSGSPKNMAAFFKEISEKHPGWRFAQVTLSRSSRPEEIDFQFDLSMLLLPPGLPGAAAPEKRGGK